MKVGFGLQTFSLNRLLLTCTQSHYREVPRFGDFYGTGIDIWAGFEPIGSTEKKVWADYEQLLRLVFSCFQVQKNDNFFLKTL